MALNADVVQETLVTTEPLTGFYFDGHECGNVGTVSPGTKLRWVPYVEGERTWKRVVEIVRP